MHNDATTVSILGCGWLGLPLGVELVARGFTVKGSTTSEEKVDPIANSGLLPFLIRVEPNYVTGDIDRLLETDVLFLNIPPGRRTGDVDDYLARLSRIVEHIERSNVKLVVFASSTSVYPNAKGTVTESDGCADGDAGPLCRAEQLIGGSDFFQTTILRFGGLYGYGRHPVFYLAGRKGLDGFNRPVNLVHRDDCVAICCLVIERRIGGEALNVCSDEHPTRGELYPEVARRYGLEPPQFSSTEVPWKCVDNTRGKQLLKYSYRYPSPFDPAP